MTVAGKQLQSSDDFPEACRLEAAMRDPAAWPKPPEGFSRRCHEALRNARLAASWGPSLRGRWLARPAKAAAAIAAVLALGGFAAWLAAGSRPGTEDVAPAELPVDCETEIITKESEVNMIARKAAGIVGAALTTLAVGSTEMTSEPTFVFLKPETSSFWHTATNSTMTVPVDFPAGATSARLRVSGDRYEKTYEGLSEGEFTFDLPPADGADTENVYDLSLVFDDAGGTERTAKLGLIQGLSPDAEGVTRCIAPANGSLWQKARTRAVLPIPYGTASVNVNGVETPTGLDGAQGWFALPIKAGSATTLSIIANEVESAATLLGGGTFMVIFK